MIVPVKGFMLALREVCAVFVQCHETPLMQDSVELLGQIGRSALQLIQFTMEECTTRPS